MQVNIAIMRAFVKLRESLATNKELAHNFKELAHKVASHDQAIAGLIHTLRDLMSQPEPAKKRPIGFVTGEEKPNKGG